MKTDLSTVGVCPNLPRWPLATESLCDSGGEVNAGLKDEWS
jgi:hypothetical protein